jgi:hypothetical protein
MGESAQNVLGLAMAIVALLIVVRGLPGLGTPIDAALKEIGRWIGEKVGKWIVGSLAVLWFLAALEDGVKKLFSH